jgi:nicotinamidase-related amidase
MKLLNEKDSLVIVIDIQDKLVAALEKDTVVSKAAKLVAAANILDIPVIVSEQYPKGLGQTIFAIKNQLPQNSEVVEKTSFSLLEEEGMLDKIKSYGKTQIILCGIETHICVHQTAAALLDAGFEVYIAKDACASRNKYEFKQGIERMHANGAKISCLEIILFEWLRGASHPKFKEVQMLIK